MTMLDRVFGAASHYQLHEVDGGWLRWWPSLGIGYLDTPELIKYEDAYWDYYNGIRGGEIGRKLNMARISIATTFAKNTTLICDVGIGNGEFVEAMGCFGTDVNPHALKWLEERGQLTPNVHAHEVLTFWDVLEHIPDPTPFFESAEVIMTSLPIHADVQACLASKHLKPGEHVWHFTDLGIDIFMGLGGFHHRAYADDIETRAGREGIMSYVYTKAEQR